MQSVLGAWQALNPIGMYFSMTRRAVTVILDMPNEDAMFEGPPRHLGRHQLLPRRLARRGHGGVRWTAPACRAWPRVDLTGQAITMR